MNAPDYVTKVIGHYMETTLAAVRLVTQRGTLNVFCVVKNELPLLADFLAHYRAGGIKDFVFIDNGSTDGTFDYLLSQPDVNVMQVHEPFSWQRKQAWIMKAILLTGRNEKGWQIYADADEHIVFDGYPHRTFQDLAREMDERGVTRVRGMLVDCYGEGPVLDAAADGRLCDTYAWFDRCNPERRFPEIISRKGGVRERAFGISPELTKYPMFRLVGRTVFANPHHLWPYDDNFASPCYLGILHYKFTSTFQDKMQAAIAEQTYWNGSAEYKAYRDMLARDPGLTLLSPDSLRYTGPETLIGAGVIAAI